MLHPAPQNHLLAALAAYLPNVRDTLAPDLKRVPLKQDHVLFDAGESPTPVLFPLSGAASILAKVERRVIEAAMVSRGFDGCGTRLKIAGARRECTHWTSRI